MSLEYTTLNKCASQLETVLKHINGISNYLFHEKLISEELYGEMKSQMEFQSFEADKAAKVILQVMRRVELEPCNYYKFINCLRQNKLKYGDVVAILDAQYFGIKDVAVSYGQAGIFFL